MQTTRSSIRRIKLISGLVSVLLAMLACSGGYVSPAQLTAAALTQGVLSTTAAPTRTMTMQVETTQAPPALPTFTDLPPFTPTPAPTRTLDPNATPKPPILYYTQAGDTLPSIMGRYGVTADQINPGEPIPDTGLIRPGVLLIIPDVLENVEAAPSVLPDSEVVYSPSAADFNITGYIQSAGGYLSRYTQAVGSRQYSGAAVVERVAMENSINPYLLLALLEYKSHWVFGNPTNLAEAEYPMGMVRLEHKGLYRQLSWTVEQLSIGYYGWRAGILSILRFRDGTETRISPGLNAGTAAMQYLFAQWYDRLEWAGALYGAESMPKLMTSMFGNFYIRSEAVEPLYPPDLQQPLLELPFVPGRVWSYTGGPHSAWGPNGALSAIDFAPPSMESGCVPSIEWVTAMAPGIIVRSENGIVIQDLDGDGIEQTGWNIMYLHIATLNRVEVGKVLNTGDKIGHPSCEGGSATGTHTHVTRKFNGEWILADGPLPFVLSGYTVHNGDKIYEGTLVKGDEVIVASTSSSFITRIKR